MRDKEYMCPHSQSKYGTGLLRVKTVLCFQSKYGI